MHSWGRASALRLSALVPPTLRGFFPIVRFGLQHNKNLLLLYTVENRGADFAICSRYLQSITLHPPVPAFPICFCSRLVEIMALSSPIDCRLYRSHSCVAHFSVSFPHYTTFPSIGTASQLKTTAIPDLMCSSRKSAIFFKKMLTLAFMSISTGDAWIG